MVPNWEEARQLIESIPGYIEPDQYQLLYDLATALDDGATILEIGSFKGRSTASLALACLGTKKSVWSIDPFTRQPTDEYSDDIWEYSLEVWSDNMKRVGVADIVHPVVGLSSDIAPSWDKELDMLFVDGAHYYDDVLADINNYFVPWLKPNGVIAIHDVAQPSPWDGIWRVWTENVAPNCNSIRFAGSLATGRKCSK